MAINFILRIFYCAGKAKNQLPTIWKFCARCSFGEMLLDEMLLAGCPFGEMLWRNALFKQGDWNFHLGGSLGKKWVATLTQSQLQVRPSSRGSVGLVGNWKEEESFTGVPLIHRGLTTHFEHLILPLLHDMHTTKYGGRKYKEQHLQRFQVQRKNQLFDF